MSNLLEVIHTLCDLDGEHHAETCQGFDARPDEIAYVVQQFYAAEITRLRAERDALHRRVEELAEIAKKFIAMAGHPTTASVMIGETEYAAIDGVTWDVWIKNAKTALHDCQREGCPPEGAALRGEETG